MLVKKFKDINISNIPSVGGKNASLGEMYNQLTSAGVQIPNGFATTARAFWQFLKENDIQEALENILMGLDRNQYSNLGLIGNRARSLLLKASTVFRLIPMPYCKESKTSIRLRKGPCYTDRPNAVIVRAIRNKSMAK